MQNFGGAVNAGCGPLFKPSHKAQWAQSQKGAFDALLRSYLWDSQGDFGTDPVSQSQALSETYYGKLYSLHLQFP